MRVSLHVMASVPMADDLPPLRGVEIFSQAHLDSVLPGLIVLVVAASYLYGVHRLRARGDRWPLARTVLFLVPGLGSIALVLASGLAAYDDTLLSVHMAQHMVLSMFAPIFLALGAPVTLALRTLPGAGRRALVAIVHSRVVRVLTLPLVSFAIFVANPFALYFTGLYRATLENDLLHQWVHLHLLVTGCLFFWPLLGLDPLPGRWPYPARALLMVLSTPFHAVLGLTIMQQHTLLAGDWYPSLHLGWADPYADQQLAGGILWAGGEIVSVTMLAVLVVQWMRASDRESRRIDRALDRSAVPTPAVRPATPAASPAVTTPAASPAAAAAPAPPLVAPGTPDVAAPVWEVPWWEAYER